MKFEVLQNFYGLKEQRLFERDEEVEMTVKRADEINKTLKDFGVFLKRIEEIEEVEEVEETKK